jgi:hypothetical protein
VLSWLKGPEVWQNDRTNSERRQAEVIKVRHTKSTFEVLEKRTMRGDRTEGEIIGQLVMLMFCFTAVGTEVLNMVPSACEIQNRSLDETIVRDRWPSLSVRLFTERVS